MTGATIAGGAGGAAKPGRRYRFAGCTIDPAGRELVRAGETVTTQRKVFDLLVYLIENRERAVDKDELQDVIWPGVIVTETSLTRCVMKARRAVGDDANRQQVIRTVHGHGYRFVAALEDAPPDPDAPLPAEAADEASPPTVPESREQQLRRELGEELELVRMLGEGQMAVVYLMRERALKRLVAVKVLRRALAADRIARRRFEREAQSAARINQRNVVAVHRVGRLADDTPFIVMEYVQGRTLAERLEAEGTLAPERARSVLGQIADALAAAHAQGIIHRDVRPDNVLLERNTDRAVLSDFGIAAVAESGSEAVTQLTQSGETLGDRTYMSPEQLLGHALTEEADIYSLGVLGYEALTREWPYRTDGIADPTVAHLRATPRPLTAIRGDVPDELSEVLRRCLAKQPERRPHSSELAKSWLEGTPLAMSDNAATATQGALASFVHELRERRVIREVAAYAAIAFILLEGASLVLPELGAPAWIYRWLVIVVLAGFPLVSVLAWGFDLRRGRLARSPVDSDSSGPGTAGRRLLQALGIALSAAVAAVAGWWFLSS